MSLQARPPEGIWGAVLLPVDRRGEIEWSALDEQLSALLESGIQGVYTDRKSVV